MGQDAKAVAPRMRKVRPPAGDGGHGSFTCVKYRCTLFVVRCVQRQSSVPRLFGKLRPAAKKNTRGAPVSTGHYDPYCAGGTCDQGNKNRQLVALRTT